MDRVAEAVGMDPIELRILNAYREGDMKAHRRTAKNTALVECCQVAASKARWPLSAEATAASSKVGGGVGERAAIPETVTDNEGRIGERRAGRVASTTPASGSGRVAAGTAQPGAVAAPPQREDMQIAAERIGHAVSAAGPAAPAPAAPVAPSQPMPAAAAPTPPMAAPTPPVAPTPAPHPAPVAATPAAPTPPAPPPAYQPEKPFSRGVKRPGASPFLSGMRRR